MDIFVSKRRTLFALLIGFLVFAACDPTHVDEEEDNGQAPAVTQRVNQYMLDLMEEVYLWESHIPTNLDIRYEMDEFDFFEKLCYRTEDNWSFITDDVDALLEGGEGVETTFGYALIFYQFSNSDSYFAVVQYVYPNTPAAKAGLKRGSIILNVDGADITANNYTNLYYNQAVLLTLGVLEGGTVYAGEKVAMTAEKLSLNPVVADTVLTDGTHKVGYICYTDYYLNSAEQFNAVFAEFKQQGVSDIVLDLRYNLGGYINAAKSLVGALCPASCLDGETVLISKMWNDLYQQYWNENNNTSQLYEYFPVASDIPVNFDLNRLYVLTGKNSASASELTICGLDPYMDVIKIGGTTRGKYTGASVFSPDEDPTIANWGAQPIIFKYANALGVTDFKNGFIPDYEVEDVILGDVYALGNPNELLLHKALELIGFQQDIISPSAQKAAAAERPTLSFPAASHFQPRPTPYHNNLLIPFNHEDILR